MSNQGLCFRNVRPEDYVVPNKKGMSASWASVEKATRSKKFIHTSVYADTFTDPGGAKNYAVNEPEWLVASKRIFPEPVPREPPLRSSHQADFGAGGGGPAGEYHGR